VSIAPANPVRALTRLSLTSHDAHRLAHFYEQALGFRRIGEDRLSEEDLAAPAGAGGAAARTTMSLGRQVVEILAFQRPGAPYPADATARDPWFQHFAIVVRDMRRAYARLSDVPGWTAISTHGPVRLPASSGGVTAFKFRDPEGHPLELLAFPADRAPPAWSGPASGSDALGIDHTAIVVADVERSIGFYQGLGFQVTARSFNLGPEQAALDGLVDPRVRVIALETGAGPPHVELLGYCATKARRGVAPAAHDVASTRTHLAARPSHGDIARPGAATMILDPDGHRLIDHP
jgi:catechol 2,3-dioxygenase-like lactoylglutathione lyase family enzyme